MTKLKVLLFVSLFTFGCDYSGSQKDTKTKSVSTDQLISANKNRLLFLSFWDGMSEQELNQIKNFENEKGNLKDGKFMLMTSHSKSIPFEIKSYDNSVSLYYEDSQWATYTGSSFGAINQIPDGKSYFYIEKTITDVFDQKYERITPPSEKKEINKPVIEGEFSVEQIENRLRLQSNEKEHKINIKWKSPSENKIIILNSEYSFFRHDFDYITAESGATEYFPHDKENKKIRIGRCTISIHYEFLDEYIKQKNDDKLREIERRKEMEQQRKEIENQIQKNNNNL